MHIFRPKVLRQRLRSQRQSISINHKRYDLLPLLPLLPDLQSLPPKISLNHCCSSFLQRLTYCLHFRRSITQPTEAFLILIILLNIRLLLSDLHPHLLVLLWLPNPQSPRLLCSRVLFLLMNISNVTRSMPMIVACLLNWDTNLETRASKSLIETLGIVSRPRRWQKAGSSANMPLS